MPTNNVANNINIKYPISMQFYYAHQYWKITQLQRLSPKN